MNSKTPLKAGDEVVAENATETALVVFVQENGVVKLDRPIQGQFYWPSAMLERRVPLLGDMLANLWERGLEEYGKKSNSATRGARERLLDSAAKAIEHDIQRGELPRVEIHAAYEDWITTCIVHKAETLDFDLWSNFTRKLALQGIEVRKDLQGGASCLVARPLGVDA